MSSSIKFQLADGTDVHDLTYLEAALADGVQLLVTADGENILTTRFAKVKNPSFPPHIILHGMNARNLDQVASYVSGDAHDRSKVQWFDGNRWHDWF